MTYTKVAQVVFDETDHAIGVIWLTDDGRFRVKACVGTNTDLKDTYEQAMEWFH
jgi:hypothetical protein